VRRGEGVAGSGYGAERECDEGIVGQVPVDYEQRRQIVHITTRKITAMFAAPHFLGQLSVTAEILGRGIGATPV